MRISRFLRILLLALAACLVPASSSAAVFISVGFAPPALPVYVQPACPQPGWMWTPGYWAYGPDGYYWVPGTWVPAPYVGALWTPGYWGWGGGLYIWHPGYWGPHVGYYGGVNYGFGFFGVGFVGGVWHGGIFAYNTAVVHVGVGPGWVGNRVYVDRTVIASHTVAVNSHVAFSGGPGGINHPPTAQENAYSHEQHMASTSYQTQHQNAAMHNTNAYASHNGGHPTNLASSRPMGTSHAGAGARSGAAGAGRFGAGAQGRSYNSSRSNTNSHAQSQGSHSRPPQHESQGGNQGHDRGKDR